MRVRYQLERQPRFVSSQYDKGYGTEIPLLALVNAFAQFIVVKPSGLAHTLFCVRTREQFREPFRKLLAGAVELFCHTAMLALILSAVRAIEWTLERLWGTKEKVLFDVVPVRFLFDGADLGLILAFLFFGGYAVYRAYFRD